MAVDEALLAEAAEEGIATLRFYGWSEPTLSLGYFQDYADRRQHPPSLKAAVVRRQSGGGAILHDRELTYSFTLPGDHPLARDTHTLYTTVHTCLAGLLNVHTSGAQKFALFAHPEHTTLDHRFLCFERRSPGDIVQSTGEIEPNAANHKVVGSAQRRRQNAVLQHGSILLARSPVAPELPGINDLTQSAFTAAALADLLIEEMRKTLGIAFFQGVFPDSLQPIAANLVENKYGHASWTLRR
jgi:lipoate-protein ligase A